MAPEAGKTRAQTHEDPSDAGRVSPSGGPGLAPRAGVDPTVPLASVLVAVGWVPMPVWEVVLERPYFGPLALPAVVAMGGVLSALIGVLRSVDLGDRRLRWTCVAIGAAGMARLFVLPWF